MVRPTTIKKKKADGRRQWHRAYRARLRALELPLVIQQARLTRNVAAQHRVVDLCLRRIILQTLRRLIFGKGDTLLIARTGFGKSLIFHSFSVLTGKITIQIIPLSKLGDEQLSDIKKMSGSNPVLVNAKSRSQEKDIIAKIREGVYTHILLGPEQVSTKSFRVALKEPELQSRIGLVAIDECHLIKDWEAFRPAYSMLCELRMILHPNIVWFACSATLDKQAEKLVLTHAGFRAVGVRPYQTEVIRTSIDRPDMSVCVQPLPKGKLGSFEHLYFLLDNCIDAESNPTPGHIPKTIVFIDGRKSVRDAAVYLQNVLLQKSEAYTAGNNMAFSISSIIQEFTATVGEYDRDQRYAEFSKPSSTIRIMVATTSLGMGVNVKDVERVVVSGFPITKSLGDAWQRVGRGGRGEGRTSIGFIFLPYWAFNTQGVDKPGRTAPAPAPPPPRVRAPRVRNSLPNRHKRSQLTQSYTPGDTSDAESVSSEKSAASCNSAADDLPFWTKEEMDHRAKLLSEWKDMVNGPCHRKAFLTFLGEYRLPLAVLNQVVRAPPDRCCNRCNPLLYSLFTSPPKRPAPLRRPKAGTQPAVALGLIEKWAVEHAELIYASPYRRFPMPSSAFMEEKCCWQLAYLYDRQTRRTFWDTLAAGSLEAAAPLCTLWRHREAYMSRLIEKLRSMVEEVSTIYEKILAQKRLAKAEAAAAAAAAQGGVSLVPTEPVEYAAYVRQRDDSLAIQVARREAARSIADRPATPLRSWVTGLISGQSSPSASSTQLSSIPDGIERAARVLEDVRRLTSAAGSRDAAALAAQDVVVFDSQAAPDVEDEVTRNSQDAVILDSQVVAVLETQPVSPAASSFNPKAVSTPGRKRRAGSQMDSPTKRLTAMQERDTNANAIQVDADADAVLIFTPRTRAGRVRVATPKGKENFRITSTGG